ncbi:TetR/AcrR family transcriptional regulator [Propionibacteriaceae bacterium Y1685]|uniref:TetR/AcrR family transcriptional regulator n=1 Tax=Microlunatus sp. Y1700 TaxID=3418487 RepID=UPI003B79DB56
MSTRSDRRPTLIEQTRRAQLMEVVIMVVAEHGHAGASLQRIADAAGITKAAVLYHFPSKDALVRASYEHVLETLVTTVGAAVDASDPADAPAAYIRTMISHLRETPQHTRMIIEAVTNGLEDRDSSGRTEALTLIMEQARSARGGTGTVDLSVLSIMVSGAMDAIIAERLERPDFDTALAAEELVRLIEPAL